MFGKIDVEMTTQVALLVSGLVTAFILHEGARKLACTLKATDALHKDGHELASGLVGGINIVFWFFLLAGGCAFMVMLCYVFQLEPKNVVGNILFGGLLSALALSSGALSGYYTR
jgi:hypothetical protein